MARMLTGASCGIEMVRGVGNPARVACFRRAFARIANSGPTRRKHGPLQPVLKGGPMGWFAKLVEWFLGSGSSRPTTAADASRRAADRPPATGSKAEGAGQPGTTAPRPVPSLDLSAADFLPI